MADLNILIVDDDLDFAESLGNVLELQGHRTELAHSGEEAVERVALKDYDLTFMDVRLPGMNGVESFLAIRKAKPQARVIMMTGHSLGQLLDQAVENGAWSVLHKPLDLKKILGLLKKINRGCILIVDDDADFGQSIADLLRRHNYHPINAQNGRKAIESIHTDNIAVLILDLRMPVLDGLQTYLELKSKGIDIPTIIVTAYAREEEESLETLRSYAVTEILGKPFDPEELLHIIERECRAAAS